MVLPATYRAYSPVWKPFHSFPFGLLHRGYNEEKHEIQYTEAEEDKIFTPQTVAGHYKYWYNGKEWQEDLNLNVYDYGARQYDPAVGRWFTVDPMAEQYFNQTPYNYVLNNPVILIDPTGMAADSTFTLTANGEIIPKDDRVYYDENGNRMDKLVSEKTGEEMLIEEGVLSTRKTEEVKRRNEDGRVKKVNVQYIETTGSQRDTQLFEFMAKNTNVEVAYSYFDNRRSFVYTSFEKNRTSGLDIILRNNPNARLQVHFHSHPDNNPDPSFDDGDTGSIKLLKKLGHKKIRAYIYTPGNDRYHYFDENSSWPLSPVEINIVK